MRLTVAKRDIVAAWDISLQALARKAVMVPSMWLEKGAGNLFGNNSRMTNRGSDFSDRTYGGKKQIWG